MDRAEKSREREKGQDEEDRQRPAVAQIYNGEMPESAVGMNAVEFL